MPVGIQIPPSDKEAHILELEGEEWINLFDGDDLEEYALVAKT